MATEKQAEGGASHWAGLAKWVVIGVVAVTFMFLFKDELKGLLSKTEEVSVSTEGIKLKVRTVDTPLGKTVLSDKAVPIPTSAMEGAPGAVPPNKITHFTDPVYGFSIDWPAGGKWIKDDALATQFGAALVIRFHQSFGNFTPNVNVLVEATGPIGVRQYLQSSAPLLQQFGWDLLDTQIDEADNAGVQVMKNPSVPGGLYQIQRVVIKNNVAYVVTASKLESDSAAFPGMYDRMSEILNSFSAP